MDEKFKKGDFVIYEGYRVLYKTLIVNKIYTIDYVNIKVSNFISLVNVNGLFGRYNFRKVADNHPIYRKQKLDKIFSNVEQI